MNASHGLAGHDGDLGVLTPSSSVPRAAATTTPPSTLRAPTRRSRSTPRSTRRSRSTAPPSTPRRSTTSRAPARRSATADSTITVSGSAGSSRHERAEAARGCDADHVQAWQQQRALQTIGPTGSDGAFAFDPQRPTVQPLDVYVEGSRRQRPAVVRVPGGRRSSQTSAARRSRWSATACCRSLGMVGASQNAGQGLVRGRGDRLPGRDRDDRVADGPAERRRTSARSWTSATSTRRSPACSSSPTCRRWHDHGAGAVGRDVPEHTWRSQEAERRERRSRTPTYRPIRC